MDLYDSIVKALDDIASNSDYWSRDSIIDALLLHFLRPFLISNL